MPAYLLRSQQMVIDTDVDKSAYIGLALKNLATLGGWVWKFKLLKKLKI